MGGGRGPLAGPGSAQSGGRGRADKEPRPRGQQMRGRCEVPRRGGEAAAGAGRPCDVNAGRPRPSGRPGSSAERHLSGGEGVVLSPAALIYTFPALPLSLLGPGKRVVTFAVNNEFWQVPLISLLSQRPPSFPGGAGRLQALGRGPQSATGPGHRLHPSRPGYPAPEHLQTGWCLCWAVRSENPFAPHSPAPEVCFVAPT